MAFKLEEIQKNYPFLSVIKIANEEKVGIIQNCDQRIISIYCYDLIRPDLQPVFLEYGGDWWWESNRTIPINLFLKKDFLQFSKYLITFNIKDTQVVRGPSVSIADLAKKRSKRRNIQLVKKVK